MKILYLQWNSFGDEDVREAFVSLGHELIIMPYSKDDVRRDSQLQNRIIEKIKDSKPDAAFTSNYFPPVAEACHEAGIIYISWVYDSPHVSLYSYTTIYDTNRIFVFDREQYEEFARNKINTVYYMPLCANPVRLRALIEDGRQQELFRNSRFYNRSDIAFIGAMYDEEHTFYRRLHNVSGYTRGYLEGVIAAQKQVWGYNFVRELLREDIMDDMSKDLPMQGNEDSVASREYLFAEYCINREITARERMEYIEEVGRRFAKGGSEDRKSNISDLSDIRDTRDTTRSETGSITVPGIDLYTGNRELRIDSVFNHGPIDHYATAPFVYDRAKINLNISLRSIHTGIPLRAFEILGSGGFLLSNYQADFADCYVDGEDYVSFGSKEDMLNKIEYYLTHEKERQEIAANGLRRTIENHTYEHRLKEMLTLCNYP